jgi:hypothetical protein
MTKERIACGKYATSWGDDVSFTTLSIFPEQYDGKDWRQGFLSHSWRVPMDCDAILRAEYSRVGEE